MTTPHMDIPALDEFIQREFPQATELGVTIESLRPRAIGLRLTYDDRQLRPGGTVSGPTMMALADQAAYLLVLSMIGPVALAVTTSLTINFLSKPAPRDILAEGTLLKLGRRLAVAEIKMYSDGAPDVVVAHATVTYSIPPKR